MPLDQIDIEMDGRRSVQEKEMSFLEHLEELRMHLIRALTAVVLLMIVAFVFHDWVFDRIVFGPTHPDFFSYRVFCKLSQVLGLGQAMCMTPPQFDKIAVGFGEPFIISIKASFVLGLVAAFPYVFYELWSFVRPGLYEVEARATRGVVFICSLLFLAGVLFGYFVIAPFAINFLMGYTIPGVENTPTLSSFVNYMIMFTAPAGLVFELPVVIYFLAKVGLVTAEDMRRYRRHAFVGILVLAAILTPPDVVTQFLIGVPLYILYEMSIFVAMRVERKEAQREQEELRALEQIEQKMQSR